MIHISWYFFMILKNWKMIYPSISYLNAIILKNFIVIFLNLFKKIDDDFKRFSKLMMIVCFSHFCRHFLYHISLVLLYDFEKTWKMIYSSIYLIFPSERPLQKQTQFRRSSRVVDVMISQIKCGKLIAFVAHLTESNGADTSRTCNMAESIQKINEKDK